MTATTAPVAPMTATDIREALHSRWPDSEYLHVNEAPVDSSRQGRKLDVLVVSLWRSRGHQLDGVEIKVSMADFRKELADGDKADWWWHHVNRFWIACPAEMAKKVKPELPATWGLLAVNGSGVRALVTPPFRECESIPWQTMIGLLRASADSGVAALQRAHMLGRDQGRKDAIQEAERRVGDIALRNKVDELRSNIASFEEASGVKIGDWNARNVGDAVKLVLEADRSPSDRPNALRRNGVSLRQHADQLDAIARAIESGAAT